jgi:hypothetical protein
MPASNASARIWAILARQSDVAVVLRRGPSKQVLLIRWHRGTDAFFPGQWFKGRIYPLRCDLSPSGERFLYFAADYKSPYYSWTAISRPPYLTALALWPKGDCWGGGGQFATERKIILNHRPAEMALADQFRLPKPLRLEPFGARSGWGEDSPLHEATLERDGWVLADAGKAVEHSFTGPMWYTFDPPQTWSKPRPGSKECSLRFMLTGYHRRGGPNRVTEAAVVTGGHSVALGEVDWADWDTNGDLLYSRDGCLYRQRIERSKLSEPRCLLDTRTYKFRPLEPSAEAVTWSESLELPASVSAGA